MQFSIRADIAKAHRDELADGSLWLGDLSFTERDVHGHWLVIESHYGMGWLRLRWGIGVGSEAFPWPFREPFERLPFATTDSERAEWGDEPDVRIVV